MKLIATNLFALSPCRLLMPALLGLGICHGPAVLGTAQSMLETDAEFLFHADLDGDGRMDTVLLDKSSGGFRAAYQLAPQAWTWSQGKATGIADLTGVAVGRWYSTARDSFAVTSPAANRIHIVAATAPAAMAQWNPVFPASLGPESLAAPDIGGPGNTAHADLWVASIENGAPDPWRLNTLRHNGTNFSALAESASSRRSVAVRPIQLKDGGAVYTARIGKLAGDADRFSVLAFSSGSAVEVLDTSLPEGSSWTAGKLAAGVLYHVLTWVPGESAFRSHAVQEGPPNVYSLAAPAEYNIDGPIGQLLVAASAEGPRLVAIGPDGNLLSVYAFDGNAAPAFLQAHAPPAGQRFTAALAVSAGGFHAFSGKTGVGRSETFTPYAPSGGQFVAQPSVVLPGLRPAALRANVFAYTGDPFVNPQATLLARYSVPEWSSGPELDGGQLAVRRELFGGVSSGLGSKAAVSVGSVPVGTAFALTSQYGDAVSLHSFDAADGNSGPSVAIDPLPGIRSQGFWMRFSASAVDAPVFFRLGSGPWQSWSNQPVFIYQDTDVSYFVRHPITLVASAIQVASYRFEDPPHVLDSDDDGVPDFVELGLAQITDPAIHLDPLGGTDSDGDGFSDLNEILVGTNPLDSASKPDADQRLKENNAFRMRVAPRPIDGSSGVRTQGASGVRLEVYGLDGTSLGGSAAQALGQPGVIGPGHRVDSLVADSRLGLVAVMTEPVFPILTADADKQRGREIAALYPIPQASRPVINYTPGGGSLAQETLAWIAAANAAYNAIELPMVAANWNEIDTLTGLLLESQIETILLDRAVPGLLPGRLTLFGGRRGDSGRFAPSAELLASLSEQVSVALPGYEIAKLHADIAAAVAHASASGLRAAATAIYRLSSLSANDSPPGTYLPPFDVLRAFVRGHALAEPYLSEVGIAPAALAAAQSTAAAITANVSPRPVESFVAVVQSDSFAGACHRVILFGSDHPIHLFTVPGQPYTPPIGFRLLPGTKIRVTGYTDVSSACGGTQLELIDIEVLEFPPAEFVDANNNLIPDDWEWAFLFGEADPYGDADGDGVSNLQELLDGTDPLNPESKADAVVDLSPPALEIFIHPQDGLVIHWDYPADYGAAFEWVLEVSDDLINWHIHPGAVVVEVEPGLFALNLPVEPVGYFRVRMIIKKL